MQFLSPHLPQNTQGGGDDYDDGLCGGDWRALPVDMVMAMRTIMMMMMVMIMDLGADLTDNFAIGYDGNAQCAHCTVSLSRN